MILVFETDLGTSLLFFGLFVVMLYVATERTSWIVFGLLLSAGGAVAVATFESHVQTRVHNWLNPLELLDGGVTETAQAMYSFGSGGILGSGLGQGYSASSSVSRRRVTTSSPRSARKSGSPD